jgi:hypothetical protein
VVSLVALLALLRPRDVATVTAEVEVEPLAA